MASPGEDEVAELPVTDASRRRRALASIAIAVIVASVACLAYLFPIWTPRLPSTQAKIAPTPPSSPAKAAPLLLTFTSPTKFFSVRYPGGWEAVPATKVWWERGASWTAAEVDLLHGRDVTFRGTSQPLDRGESAGMWLGNYLAAAAPTCGDHPDESVAIDGHLGVIDSNGCPPFSTSGQFFDVAVVAAGRGYNFTMEGSGDRALFLAMVATLRLGLK